MGPAPIHRRLVLQTPLKLQKQLHSQLNLDGGFSLRRTRRSLIPLGAQTLRIQLQTKQVIQRMALFRTLHLAYLRKSCLSFT